MMKKLAMLLATVDAAMIDQKGRKCEGVCREPSLTCPDIVVGRCWRTAKASEVRILVV
jgi:hypothetical protein